MIRSLNQTGEKVRPSLAQAPSAESWQEELRTAIRCPRELCRMLGIPERTPNHENSPARKFPLLVPRGFVSRMKPGDTSDPLLLQVLPQDEEYIEQPGAERDAVGDAAATVAPGLIKKYQGRALLISSPACAVHCRYCFRRHFPYEETPKGFADWRSTFSIIANDKSIREVILSGGDPLSLVDASLAQQVEALSTISHLKRLRIHTRLPIVIPRRVTKELVRLFSYCRLSVVVVVHINHANELSEDVREALDRLRSAGAILYNQTVLLRGVNDSAQTLVRLSERLLDCGVTPYYLHKLDHVTGASHFRTQPGQGESLIEAMREQLPGYAVPQYVEEVPGMDYKKPLA